MPEWKEAEMHTWLSALHAQADRMKRARIKRDATNGNWQPDAATSSATSDATEGIEAHSKTHTGETWSHGHWHLTGHIRSLQERSQIHSPQKRILQSPHSYTFLQKRIPCSLRQYTFLWRRTNIQEPISFRIEEIPMSQYICWCGSCGDTPLYWGHPIYKTFTGWQKHFHSRSNKIF